MLSSCILTITSPMTSNFFQTSFSRQSRDETVEDDRAAHEELAAMRDKHGRDEENNDQNDDLDQMQAGLGCKYHAPRCTSVDAGSSPHCEC